MPETANVVPTGLLEHVNGWFPLVGLLLLCAVPVIIAWINKVSKDSKAVAEANKALILEKEKAEMERTEHRAAQRTAEISGMSARLDNRIDKVETALFKHFDDHKLTDNAIHESINKLGLKIDKMEDNMHSINVNIAEIRVRMEMNETERKRNEHCQ